MPRPPDAAVEMPRPPDGSDFNAVLPLLHAIRAEQAQAIARLEARILSEVAGVSVSVEKLLARQGKEVSREVPKVTIAIDDNRDGRPDRIVTGEDLNRDGIPDILQQQAAPVATVAIDVNRDGRTDKVVVGADLNQDGIPDCLQDIGQTPTSFMGKTSTNRTDSPSQQVSHPRIPAPAPERAFVINMPRLVELKEKLALLHEFITSTAIAAFTLVAAGSWSQMLFTTLFLFSSFILFTMHHSTWDSFDIEDLGLLYPLLADDVDPDREDLANPNRVLKALSISTSTMGNHIKRVVNIFSACVVSFCWLVLARHWDVREASMNSGGRLLAAKAACGVGGTSCGGSVASSGTGDVGFPWNVCDHFIEEFFVVSDDSSVMGMQVMVGSVLFFLHLIFEFVISTEISAVMPDRPDGKIWDPRVHGLPMRHRFFGMPAMWFTSQKCLTDLKKWMGMARQVKVEDISPQEIAFLVLAGEEERSELMYAFKKAKLYDAHDHSFTTNEDGRMTLELDLWFFDPDHQCKEYQYAGAFSCMTQAEDYASLRSTLTGSSF